MTAASRDGGYIPRNEEIALTHFPEITLLLNQFANTPGDKKMGS